MKVIRNFLFSVGLIFRYTPWNALFYIVGFFGAGTFSGIQIILVKNVVDSGMAYVSGRPEALESIMINGIALVALLFFWIVLQRFGAYENKVIETKMTRHVAADVMEKLQKLDYAAFESKDTQEVLQRISNSPWFNITRCFDRAMLSLQTLSLIHI